MFESENLQAANSYTSEFTNEELNRIRSEFKRLEGKTLFNLILQFVEKQ